MSATDQYSSKFSAEKWKELALASLKGADLEKVLNKSTVEGVNYRGLYDQRKADLEFYSFPDDFKAAPVYDSFLISKDELEEDFSEGADSAFLVVKGKKWNRNFEGVKASYLLQNVDEKTLSEFSGVEQVYVDCNKLEFSKFNSEVKRVLDSGLGLAINISQVHNAGASCAQEISYGLNMLDRLIELGAPVDKINFIVATDSLFFMSIAKLRALRFLAEEVLAAFDKDPKVKIISLSSLREQTLYDPWVNALRNTTSSMAAVLGGADCVGARPMDSAYSHLTGERHSGEARRNARNILNILKDETHLEFVKDAGKGSFAIEALSAELCEQGWESYLNWKEKGFFDEMKDFSKSVEAMAKARYERARKRKNTITGVTDFANPEETLESIYKKTWTPVDLASGLFPLRRNSYEFEALRIAAENAAEEIKVALLWKGELSALSGRMNFARNVFEIIGVKVVEIEVGENEKEAYDEAKKVGAQVLALVAKDGEYAPWASFDKGFSSAFIAGREENNEGLGSEFDYLFMGQNLFKALQTMLKNLGAI